VTAAGQYTNLSIKWLLIAAAGFSLGSVIDDPVMSVVATGSATVMTLVGIVRPKELGVSLPFLAGTLVLVVTLVANSQRIARFSVRPGSYALWFTLALATGVVALLSRSISIQRIGVLLALSTVVVGSLSILIPDWQPLASSDVFRGHVAAGSALVAGESPYSDAVVVESGDPNKPDGTLIEGYSYPPPPLLTYGILSVVTDPRVVSFASWLTLSLGLAVLAIRSGTMAATAFSALMLIATMPVWRMALFMSWTEPLSVSLIAGALVGILRGRKWGWFVLGIGLASKQYLVFLAPIVLLYQDKKGNRPGWVSIGAAGIIAAFPAIFGFSDYYKSVIGNALDIGFRPDTQSINGAIASLGGDWLAPVWVLLPVVIGLLMLFAKLPLPRAILPAAGVATLSMTLLVTSSFPNYWMLVAALSGLSAVACAYGGIMPADTVSNSPTELPTKH
jgi:hypothetical protein